MEVRSFGITMGIAAVTLLIQALPARADLILNGGFEITTGNASSFKLSPGTAPNAPDDWTFSSLGDIGCVVFPASTTSQTNACGAGFTSLYPGWTLSPAGGNFVAMDGGAAYAGTLSQSVNVVFGQTYDVSFYQAAEQYEFYTGATTEQWHVTFDGQSQDSDLMNNASTGFVPWELETLQFTATTTGSTLLSFLAEGTPGGEPPVVLLDSVGVSVATSPEPATYGFLALGLFGIIGVRRSRKRRG